jgi:hypothetical protein
MGGVEFVRISKNALSDWAMRRSGIVSSIRLLLRHASSVSRFRTSAATAASRNSTRFERRHPFVEAVEFLPARYVDALEQDAQAPRQLLFEAVQQALGDRRQRLPRRRSNTVAAGLAGTPQTCETARL